MMEHAARRWGCVLAMAVAASSAHAVKVYDATEISYDRYQVIKRLPVQSWVTVFGVRHHATRDAAIESLVRAAERAGADGLVNVYCVGGTASARGHYCYGNAIRRKAKP